MSEYICETIDSPYGEYLRPVEPLIRCKDCKYYNWSIDMCEELESSAHNVVHPDDYCSKAEERRK